MPRAKVEALGLERHPRYAKMTIPYTVYYDAHGRVRGVEVSLEHAGREVTLEGRRIPGHATFAEAVAAVGGCAKPAPQTGGTVARCHGGVEVKGGRRRPGRGLDPDCPAPCRFGALGSEGQPGLARIGGDLGPEGHLALARAGAGPVVGFVGACRRAPGRPVWTTGSWTA